jgi:hypothetical protein
MDNDQSIEQRLNALAGDDTRSADDVEASDEDSVMSDSSLVQHIVRSRSDQQETICGQFRVSFSRQQSAEVLHIPLHPPMTSVPSVEAYCENEKVRIRVTDVQRFGVRLEIKMPSPEGSGHRSDRPPSNSECTSASEVIYVDITLALE